MFQITEKNHNMKTRVLEKCIETNARTVGLAKSAIPTIQKHLNNNHQIL